MDNPVYSLIIPIYNEDDILPKLHARLSELLNDLDAPTAVILVDDGSKDSSWALMLSINAQDPRFKLISLSRSFGHQIAITAGIDQASGKAIIMMDADLQDPPEIVIQMTKKWQEGYDVVYGIRQDCQDETWFKRNTATLFYRILHKLTDLKIPVETGDFRLVDRKAVDAFKALREKSRYVRGMFSWVGFKQTGIRYKRAARYAGNTKCSMRKMITLATDGILGFSTAPLKAALNLRISMAALPILIGLCAITQKYMLHNTVHGWVSLVVTMSSFSGIDLFILGVIGEYVGRIHEEVKRSPLYIIGEQRGFDNSAPKRWDKIHTDSNTHQ